MLRDPGSGREAAGERPAAKLVLAPVGGPWRQGEVLVYAAREEAAHYMLEVRNMSLGRRGAGARRPVLTTSHECAPATAYPLMRHNLH